MHVSDDGTSRNEQELHGVHHHEMQEFLGVAVIVVLTHPDLRENYSG